MAIRRPAGALGHRYCQWRSPRLMSTGKLMPVLIQKSFNVQHKTCICSESTHTGLDDFSYSHATFCFPFTAASLVTMLEENMSINNNLEDFLTAWVLVSSFMVWIWSSGRHQRHSTSQARCWTRSTDPCPSRWNHSPTKAAASRTIWDSISFWRVFQRAGCRAGHRMEALRSFLFSQHDIEGENKCFICWLWSVTFSLQK